MEKVWTWRDSGNHGPMIKAVNLACSWSGYTQKPLVAEHLMERAMQKTRLSDFGDPAFCEGLERLCLSFSADRGLSGLGHLAANAMIAGTLANRLLVVDWYKSHPKVQEEIIDRPWVITGLPRSGTTLGAHLLDLGRQQSFPAIVAMRFSRSTGIAGLAVLGPGASHNATKAWRELTSFFPR